MLVCTCAPQVRAYGEVFAYLREAVGAGKRVWLDKDKTNFALFQAALGPEALALVASMADGDADGKDSALPVVTKPSPITLLKALKVKWGGADAGALKGSTWSMPAS
jgi:hypothetical protein